MAEVWTHGTWSVKPGREEEFIRAWRAMARRALSEVDVPREPTLLRDRERPSVFLTFGPWHSVEDIERFRASAAFREGVAAMDGLLESFEPRTLDEVGLHG